MKQIFIMMMFALCSFCAKAQVSYGTYVSFPNNNFATRAYHKKLAFGKVNDSYVLALKYVDAQAYKDFDQTSQLLLKFGDEIVHVPMSKIDSSVAKEYDQIRNGNILCKMYITYTAFDIDDDVVSKIVDKQEPISKVRVIFTNGEYEDYDIKSNYQPKLIKGLVESYESVASQDGERKEIINNDESGF